jgi:CHAT domain-containing protein
MKALTTILFFVSLLFSWSQEPKELDHINAMIRNQKGAEARQLIERQLDQFRATTSYSAIIPYLRTYNQTTFNKEPNQLFSPQVADLIKEIETNAPNPNSLYRLYSELAKLAHDGDRLQQAYDYETKAHEQAQHTTDHLALTESEYYLAEYGMKLGNFNLLQQHIEKALVLVTKISEKDFQAKAKIFNLKAGLLYISSQADSAEYYYKKALKVVERLPKTPENQEYIKPTIIGNWSMLERSRGNYQKSMDHTLESVRLFSRFLAHAPYHPLGKKVKTNLAFTYVDIGGLYADMGDMEKSVRFAQIAYDFTKRNFDPNTFQHFFSLLTMAQAAMAKKEYDNAERYLNSAKASLSKMEGDNFLYHAQLYSIYGRNFMEQKMYSEAKESYELSEKHYAKNQEGQYDQNRFYDLLNLGELYAITANQKQSQDVFEKLENYLNTQGEDDNRHDALLFTKAKIALKLEKYNEVYDFAQQGLELYEIKNHDTYLDKLHFEEYKMDLLLFKAQAMYHNTQTHTTETLEEILVPVKKAIAIVEEKMGFVATSDNINNLMEVNGEVFDFAKKIHLELYTLTKNKSHLTQIIQLHESALYNTIRGQLNQNDNIRYSGVPLEITQKEDSLKNRLLKAPDDPQTYLKNIGQWESFKGLLKTNYPNYYKLRYGSATTSIEALIKKLPDATTVLRYLFIDNSLYTLVISGTDTSFHKLEFDPKRDGHTPDRDGFSVVDHNARLYRLYTQLWKPLEASISTENVIIIPDGWLFNLSFETFTRKTLTSFNEFSSHSLLARYNLAYNYSLLLVDKNKKPVIHKNNFISFSPEFNDQMKRQYTLGIKDSIDLDRTYLTLLPQPFNKTLANKYSRFFHGKAYINENASKQLFVDRVKEHKIIHIGTHAESNNINPELSRLVFAKNLADSTDINDNYLYSYEIYDQNLSSNLAVLTACETGKPSYRPGEGMISLAHAFTYAGSESILTSLWQIDEQASAMILDGFYKNLSDGLPKDLALRNAKLDYLATAQGRTLAPQYWAGLILMGDSNPLTLTSSNDWVWWALLVVVLVVVWFYIGRQRRKP